MFVAVCHKEDAAICSHSVPSHLLQQISCDPDYDTKGSFVLFFQISLFSFLLPPFSFPHICPALNLLSPWLLIFSAPPKFLSFLRTVYYKCHNTVGLEKYLFPCTWLVEAVLCLWFSWRQFSLPRWNKRTHIHCRHTYLPFPVKCNPIMWERLFKIFLHRCARLGDLFFKVGVYRC